MDTDSLFLECIDYTDNLECQICHQVFGVLDHPTYDFHCKCGVVRMCAKCQAFHREMHWGGVYVFGGDCCMNCHTAGLCKCAEILHTHDIFKGVGVVSAVHSALRESLPISGVRDIVLDMMYGSCVQGAVMFEKEFRAQVWKFSNLFNGLIRDDPALIRENQLKMELAFSTLRGLAVHVEDATTIKTLLKGCDMRPECRKVLHEICSKYHHEGSLPGVSRDVLDFCIMRSLGESDDDRSVKRQRV